VTLTLEFDQLLKKKPLTSAKFFFNKEGYRFDMRDIDASCQDLSFGTKTFD
jgi:hypothetical protein